MSRHRISKALKIKRQCGGLWHTSGMREAGKLVKPRALPLDWGVSEMKSKSAGNKFRERWAS